MFKRAISIPSVEKNRRPRLALSLAAVFLLIEFFDELHFGAGGAMLPALRSELGLAYAQVGLLLGLPQIVNTLVEPGLMLLGDTRLRCRLVLGGGLVIAAALVLTAWAPSFPVLLAAAILIYPASGAFVSLSQATLMDLNHGRQAHWMARWTAAGSVGNLVGPLLAAGVFALGGSWRWIYAGLAVLALALAALLWRRPFPAPGLDTENEGAEPVPAPRPQARTLLRQLVRTARQPRLARWILLLLLSDLLTDVFIGFAPLYFTDAAGFTPAQAGLLLGVWTAAGLAGDLALIPLLERFPGRRMVRLSAAAASLVYLTWLLAPWPAAKVAGLPLLGLVSLGWYSVLQAEAYAAAPGRSGAVNALLSLSGLLSGAIAGLLGWTAGQFGLPTAMALLLLGPVGLALWTPGEEV